MKTSKRRAITAVGGLSAVLTLIPSIASAQEAEPVTILGQQTSLMWVVIGAAMVVFMQAGFALVETGFCRAKHAAHVVSTNFAIFGLGFVAFFFVGFPLAFGGFSYSAFGLDAPVGSALLGSGNWVFLWKGGWALSGENITPALLGFFLYMVAFMDTTATIPTGSMAERWKWGSFTIWGLFCGALYYPLFAAWTWGGGWLSKTWDTMSLGAGYVDFAGSGVVHAAGGVAALAGAIILGPRIGKFSKDGTPRAMPGHHIPMAMLGTFILLFGWFGFNAASTMAATDVQFATVATNTAIGGAFGGVVAMVYITKRTGKPDPGMMVNGMLAGLVAITAPCAFVAPWAAAVIGSVAAVLVIESVFFVERKLKLDDPVGAISVHGVCGLFGVLAVGIFANGSYGAGWNGSSVEGVSGLIKGDVGQFGAQLLGVAVLGTVIFGVSYAFFYLQNKISIARGKGGIRSAEDDEINGLDIPELGVTAYPDFVTT
ncbi:MAG: ammonium transporter [Acidimicrobiia bacterium]|nr:ammonium transporter [Acidimicrobiia bacterium]MBP8179511.1 ammonium transporter [Acidimicrobiia bacterium]